MCYNHRRHKLGYVAACKHGRYYSITCISHADEIHFWVSYVCQHANIPNSGFRRSDISCISSLGPSRKVVVFSFLMLRLQVGKQFVMNDSSLLIFLLTHQNWVKYCIIQSHHILVKYCIMVSHHNWVRYWITIGATVLRAYLWTWSNLFSWIIGCVRGAITFACKSQECLWQDWYIFNCIFVKEYVSLLVELYKNNRKAVPLHWYPIAWDPTMGRY